MLNALEMGAAVRAAPRCRREPPFGCRTPDDSMWRSRELRCLAWRRSPALVSGWMPMPMPMPISMRDSLSESRLAALAILLASHRTALRTQLRRVPYQSVLRPRRSRKPRRPRSSLKPCARGGGVRHGVFEDALVHRRWCHRSPSLRSRLRPRADLSADARCLRDRACAPRCFPGSRARLDSVLPTTKVTRCFLHETNCSLRASSGRCFGRSPSRATRADPTAC